MNFRSLNPLNVRANFVSGNLLPLAPGDSRFPITLKLYSGFLWLMQMIHTIALIFGLFLVPWEKALIDGTVTFAVTIEVFLIMRLHARRPLIDRLIQKLNDILSAGDETMRSIVTRTLKPLEIPLKLYSVAGALSVFMWCCTPFLLVFTRSSFLYEDFRTPAAFSRQPFSTGVFLLGSFVVTIGNNYVFLKKVGADIYVIHLVLLTTAQYQYISARLAAIFRDGVPQSETAGEDRQVEKEMRALCRHHTDIIRLSSVLKRLLAFNFSMIYVNSVFRFSFIGIMLSAIPSLTFLEGFSIVVYASGAIVQFYMLCFCVQRLLDASKKVTDEAFYEKWYQFGPSVKRIFLLMMLSNKLECKISSCDKYNLSLSSYMTILNQSYSITLLLLRMK